MIPLTLADLIGKGFFPRELPPPFSSLSFSMAVSSSPTFRALLLEDEKHTKFGKHSYSRVGELRRTFGVVNPTTQFQLAVTLLENWDFLKEFCCRSQLSLSTPTIYPDSERAISKLRNRRTMPRFRAFHRLRGRYLLTTDISRFYPTIYTHSIPWALHSKAVAKKGKGKNLLGDLIDKRIRQTQDRQSLGIPIGPDTSNLISEILLSPIDVEIKKRIGHRPGYRYVDDYEIVFDSLSEAEHAYSDLQELLSEYELATNPNKTKIIELPHPVDDVWIADLSQMVKPKKFRNPGFILNYFNKVFDLSSQFPNSYVLKYGIARSRGYFISKFDWNLYQHLMLQCAIKEPSTLEKTIGILLGYKKLGYYLDESSIGETLCRIIDSHSSIGHGSEVAWALWTAITLNIKIPRQCIKKVQLNTDPVVILLALDAKSRDLFESPLDISAWKPFFDEEELRGENWLVAYEANVRGWSIDSADYVSKDPIFRAIKDHGVRFYNPDISSAPLPIGDFDSEEEPTGQEHSG